MLYACCCVTIPGLKTMHTSGLHCMIHTFAPNNSILPSRIWLANAVYFHTSTHIHANECALSFLPAWWNCEQGSCLAVAFGWDAAIAVLVKESMCTCTVYNSIQLFQCHRARYKGVVLSVISVSVCSRLRLSDMCSRSCLPFDVFGKLHVSFWCVLLTPPSC